MYAKRLWSSHDNGNVENAQFLREMVHCYKMIAQYTSKVNQSIPNGIPQDLTPTETLMLLIYSHGKSNAKTNENRLKKFYTQFIKPVLF